MATDNVYRKIELFYQGKKESNMIVRKTRMERYFRELAWQGKTDALLRRIFGVVSTLLAFMVQRKLGAFYLLTRYDYVELFHIYASARPKLRLIEQNVELFFSYLNDFLQAMTPDDEEVHTVLRESRALFYENGIFAIPERQNYDEFCDTLEHTEEIDEEALDHLNELLDGLVTDMIAFFQRDEHRQDFARAMMLFSGPYIKPEDADENWWMSFWDYFFFDYHRKEDDLSIVRYYLEAEKDRLSTEQQYVLRDLMRAKLTVFCVNYLDEDVAVCTNLFSGEEINLPCPDVGFVEYKNMVFFGHIQRRGVMLLNYISGLSASKRLQRRMKDEILKQFEQFRAYQMPSATLEDFFVRHAAAVRHTIQILSGFAQLRVVPDIIAAPPARGTISAALLEPEETRLEETARSLHFSAYAIFFAKRLYEDYVAKIKRRGTQAALAAILVLIEGVNGTEYAPAHKIFSAFGVEQEAAIEAMKKLGFAVNCVAFDPRYLTEEGFVQLLYMV